MEVHGDECELTPVYMINTPRMPMTGRAEEHSVDWEADRHDTDAVRSYEELSNTVKDYARKSELDTEVQKSSQLGSDPKDVEEAHEWYIGNSLGEEVGRVGHDRGKCKGTSDGKGSCFSCGRAGHFARDCPYSKGQGK